MSQPKKNTPPREKLFSRTRGVVPREKNFWRGGLFSRDLGQNDLTPRIYSQFQDFRLGTLWDRLGQTLPVSLTHLSQVKNTFNDYEHLDCPKLSQAIIE